LEINIFIDFGSEQQIEFVARPRREGSALRLGFIYFGLLIQTSPPLNDHPKTIEN
jgi:hypothetical protein